MEIFKKGIRTLYQKFFFHLDQWEYQNKKNIKRELEKAVLKETVEYVQTHLHNAVAFSSSNEIYDYVLQILQVPNGLVCEFGVWQGTSINYIAKKLQATVHGFDSFEGLPEHWHGDYTKARFSLNGNLPKVEKNIILHKGWFEDTLPEFIKKNEGPLSLLHVDADLYSSAKTVFHYLADRIVAGTIIIFDEYFNYPFWKHHEYKAFQEFIQKTGYKYEYLCYNQLHEQVAVRITES